MTPYAIMKTVTVTWKPLADTDSDAVAPFMAGEVVRLERLVGRTLTPIARTLTIASCELRRLHTIDEADAALTGMVTKGSHLAEFTRQWGVYRDAQAWGANPLCWRTVFTLDAKSPGKDQ